MNLGRDTRDEQPFLGQEPNLPSKQAILAGLGILPQSYDRDKIMKQHVRWNGNRALCGYISKNTGNDVLADYNPETEAFEIEQVQISSVSITCKSCIKSLAGYGIKIKPLPYLSPEAKEEIDSLLKEESLTQEFKDFRDSLFKELETPMVSG